VDGKNVDKVRSVKEYLENDDDDDEIVDVDNDCESGGEGGIHWDFLDALAMSSEIHLNDKFDEIH
jgi:hypothetical protein